MLLLLFFFIYIYFTKIANKLSKMDMYKIRNGTGNLFQNVVDFE